MPRFLPIITASAILILPATALAIPIHVHEKVPVEREVVLHDVIRGDPLVAQADVQVVGTKVDVIHVAPADDDDDGVATADDPCPQTAGSDGGCPPPEPVYVRSSGTGGYSGTGMTNSPVDGYYGTGDAIPSYITQCESGGDYGAYNPSSGATGAYQIIPSTAAAYGCDLSYPAGQDACASEIYAAEGAGAWDCG
jgi:hypothetical protein